MIIGIILIVIFIILFVHFMLRNIDKYTEPQNTGGWTIVFDDGPWTSTENPVKPNSEIENRSVQYHLGIAQSIRRVPKNSTNRYIMALNGLYAEKYAREILELDKAGVIIANHSYKHSDYGKMSLEECVEDWAKTQKTLENVLGYEPTIFQYPFLNHNDEFTDFLEKQNIEVLYPNYCFDDYKLTEDEVMHEIKLYFNGLLEPNIVSCENEICKSITMHSCKATAGCIKDIINLFEDSTVIPYGGTYEGIRDCTLWAGFEDRIYLQQYCTQFDIPYGPVIYATLNRDLTLFKEIITNLATSSFVIKMNHLSGGNGILIVVDGVITKYFKYIPKVIETNKITLSTIDSIVKDVDYLWDVHIEDCVGEQSVRPGVVVENLIDDGFEIKVHCWYGEPLYVHIVRSTASPFHYEVVTTCSVDEMLEIPNLPSWLSEKALLLASTFSNHTKMDYVRVDIRIIGDQCIITEVTRCGQDIDNIGKEILNKRIQS